MLAKPAGIWHGHDRHGLHSRARSFRAVRTQFGFPVRDAKTNRNFYAERDRLQEERVAAYKEYITDVTIGAFPETRHSVTIDEGVLHEVWEANL